MGFPCNQFGAQEPGSAEEIRAFVTENFDIDFPMFAKIEVNGPGTAPLYQWLKAELPGGGDSADIPWNFTKFLVGPGGRALKRWSPQVTPEQIASELAAMRG